MFQKKAGLSSGFLIFIMATTLRIKLVLSELVASFAKNAVMWSAYLWLFISCDKPGSFDCVKRNGTKITVTRQLDNFDKVLLNGKIESTIYKGNEYKVEITAGKNLIPKITTRVVNGELVIDDTNFCNFVRGFKNNDVSVKVTMPYVRLATNDGVSNMYFEKGFSQDILETRVGGIGDIFINGSYKEIKSSTHGGGNTIIEGITNSLSIYANGTCFIKAQNLIVKDHIFLSSLTLGNIYLNADSVQLMEYNIESDGNVYYSGNPKQIKNFGSVSSKGKLIRQ